MFLCINHRNGLRVYKCNELFRIPDCFSLVGSVFYLTRHIATLSGVLFCYFLTQQEAQIHSVSVFRFTVAALDYV